MTLLGRDFAATFGARFAGRLATATFTKWTAGALDPTDPTGPTLDMSATYTCDGLALGYAERFVDGEQIKTGDYRAVLMRGSIVDDAAAPAPSIVPNPGDTISIPPPNETTPKIGAIVAIESITAAAVTVQVRGAAL